ncbi:MAG: hypothetical protein JNK82_30830 [Myxococcaceae bacterium]|nr:hypothetical protein [Myxococcaceae bacterium]
MRKPTGHAIVFVVLSLPFSALAADTQRLEDARKQLSAAVERIRQDPPSNADLDAAHEAVEALKVIIDGGAELEASDLEYAKAALAARKELRTQRDYVDQRRANVKIFDARRAIDTALKELAEASAKVKAKDPVPGAPEFAAVRDVAARVKKVADDSRQFGKQDAKFASYLGGADDQVAKALLQTDERETGLAVDKQRASLEEARAALKTAAGAIGKDATDDQFKEADKAMAELNKRLDAGKELEVKSKPYAGEAGKVRAEQAATKKKLDEQWTATGLARLKGEIEPQFKDLQAAAKPLRGKPSTEQLAEAKTAAIVVRGLVEKFAAEAQRSQAFGQYVEQVKRTLVEVETLLEQKSLTAAQLDVGIAQRTIEKKSPTPTDEQFAELATALSVLEKTLATVHKQEPSMAKSVGEAEWVLREAKKIQERRRLEVDVELQMKKVEDARKIAGDAMNQLGPPTFGHDQVKQAEAAVKLIGTMLDEGTALKEQDKNYNWYDGEVRKRIAELNDKIGAKKVQLAAREAGQALADAITTAKAKLDVAKAPEGKDSDLEAAIAAVEAVDKRLTEQADLEKKDGQYAKAAEKGRNEGFKLVDVLELTKLQRELRKKTGEALMLATAATEAGAGMKDLRKRKGEYEKALGLYRSCQSEGTQLVKMLPALVKLPVLAEGKLQTPREVMDQCGTRATAAEQLMKDVAPLIKFEDGPKKSYEAGKKLLDAKKEKEALAQYNECIATGIILKNNYPAMADQSFDVAGGQKTLSQIIDVCVEKRKALMGGK